MRPILTDCFTRSLLAIMLFLAAGGLAAGAEPPILQDTSLTPGTTFHVDASVVCKPGYAKSVRHVGRQMKLQVYAEYGIVPNGRAFEIDHLIPLELGGSNSIKNLWPEARFTQPWNALVKDRLERHLHRLVCSGRLQLQEAQRSIASNWITAYRQYMPRGQLPVASPNLGE